MEPVFEALTTTGSLGYMVPTYAVYVLISLAITYWVGRTLHKNGRVFLVENFEGREALADSVNHLLLVGFYLVNVGFVSLALRFGSRPTSIVEAIEYLSTKIGIVIVVIGFMHFFNMFWLVRFRKSRFIQKIGTGYAAQTTAALT
jgi:protein-S-isoprenylcysteine O-methyltransferase Ste14